MDKPIPAAVRAWLDEWCEDHGVTLPADAYNELLEPLTAAQQQGQAVAWEVAFKQRCKDAAFLCREHARDERSKGRDAVAMLLTNASECISGLLDEFGYTAPPSAPVVDEAMTRRIIADFHANDPGDVWPPDEQGRLRRQALQDAINKHLAAAPALAQQPAAVALARKYPDDGNGDDDAYNRGWNACLEALAAQHQEPTT